jgi:phage terminase Nu1 subunit (DNA packaging protein)
MDADRLTIEVLQARGYPVSDFDQRAADISIKYPAVVTNYRAAREITVKNEQKLADTEELRQAFIHYRSLFEELLKASAK